MSKFRNYNLLDTLQPCAPKRSSERRVYVYRTMKINSDASLSHKVVEIVEEVVSAQSLLREPLRWRKHCDGGCV